MKNYTLPALLAAVCAMFISACASHGPTYRDSKASITPKPGKGLVFIFWKPATGVPKFHVYANDVLLTSKLGLGDFFAYDAPPGPLRLTSTGGSGNLTQDAIVGTVAGGGVGGLLSLGLFKKKDAPTFDVLPAETYYVEMSTTGWREKLRLISKEEGEKKIQGCHWINAPGNSPHP